MTFLIFNSGYNGNENILLDLISEISKHKFKNRVIIGTGSNSLQDTKNLMHHSIKLGLTDFLIGNPAYYQNTNEGVLISFQV